MTVLISGASSGIGAALASHYALKNYNLILLARSEDKLQNLKEQLQTSSNFVDIYIIDLTDFDALHELAKKIDIKYNKIDIIILNAGISIGHSAEITPFKEFKKLYDTNVLSVHALLEPLIHSMKKHHGSKVVFISSLASIITMPSSVAYSSSKRSLNAYAEGLRYQLKKYGIKVITILPGFIDTPLTQKNQFKMPFFMSLDNGVKEIVGAIERGKRVYAFPKRFYFLIKLTTLLPQFMRDKIVSKVYK